MESEHFKTTAHITLLNQMIDMRRRISAVCRMYRAFGYEWAFHSPMRVFQYMRLGSKGAIPFRPTPRDDGHQYVQGVEFPDELD